MSKDNSNLGYFDCTFINVTIFCAICTRSAYWLVLSLSFYFIFFK